MRSLVLVLFGVLLLCATVSLANEDPELRQCKHRCRDQRQFDPTEVRQCEEKCVRYIEEKEGRRGREINPSRDPDRQFRECRERCQEEKEGRREQQLCESVCERRRQDDRRQRGREEDSEDELYRIEDRERSEEWVGEEGERGNPYVFQEGHFSTKFGSQEGKVRVLQKFTKRSKLLKGIENYRVVIFEARPQTFVLPNHWDADSIFFVAQGKGTVSLVYTDRRESFNVERGHLMVIPAGVTVYIINRDNNEELTLVKLINPVSNPGKFEAFFGAGGENPESFFNVFSPRLLEAAFNTSRDVVQETFSQQRDGAIIRASEEQIRALAHEKDNRWPFGTKGKDTAPFNLLRQNPKEANEYGQLFEADLSDNKHLQELGISVSFANITQGSMITPHYNSRSTKIAVVLNGRGYFEMACPHLSSSGRSHHQQSQQSHHQQSQQSHQRRGDEATSAPVHYEKVSSELRRGSVYVVPAGHPFITVASENENLEVVCFEINAENNHKFPLAGKKSIMRNFQKEAKELAFGREADEVDRLLESQEGEFFLQGPRSQRHRGIATY